MRRFHSDLFLVFSSSNVSFIVLCCVARQIAKIAASQRGGVRIHVAQVDSILPSFHWLCSSRDLCPLLFSSHSCIATSASQHGVDFARSSCSSLSQGLPLPSWVCRPSSIPLSPSVSLPPSCLFNFNQSLTRTVCRCSRLFLCLRWRSATCSWLRWTTEPPSLPPVHLIRPRLLIHFASVWCILRLSTIMPSISAAQPVRVRTRRCWSDRSLARAYATACAGTRSSRIGR